MLNVKSDRLTLKIVCTFTGLDAGSFIAGYKNTYPMGCRLGDRLVPRFKRSRAAIATLPIDDPSPFRFAGGRGAR